MSGRFQKGQSGNPAGRPKKRRPHVSAFDIVFDKSLTVTQQGVERELTVDEALQLQTYQAGLKGSKLAVRAVLKMIEKRENALRQLDPPAPRKPAAFRRSHATDSANEVMLLLNIICKNPRWSDGSGPRPLIVETWAAQAAISRPGKKRMQVRQRDELRLFVNDYDKLKYPREVR